MRIFIVILALLIGSFSAEAQTANKYYKAGYKQYKKGNYELALQHFTHAVDIDPSFVDAFFMRGSVYKALEQYTRALSDLEQVILISDYRTNAYLEKGEIYSEIGDSIEALYCADMVLEHDEDDIEALYLRAYVLYVHFNKLDEALDDIERSIWLDPSYPQDHCLQAEILLDMWEYDAALESIDRAIEMEPKDPYYYYIRACIKEAKTDYEGAQKDLEKALRFDNDEQCTPCIYFELAFIKDELGELQNAIDGYSKVIEFDPKYSEAYYNRAMCYLELDEIEAACADLDKALELGDKDAMEYIQEYCD